MSEFTKSSFGDQKPVENIDGQFQRPKKNKKRGRLSCFFILAIIVIWILTAILTSANNSFFGGIKNGFVIRQITRIFDAESNKLRGEDQDRVNFLLLGMGGPGHEGPYLSDTIILASLQPSTGEVAMISIPRDMVVPFGDGTYRKINSIYALNINSGPEVAFDKVKTIIGNTFGQEIHYMATIDFQGFVEIIDELGGVEVEVERSFTDNQFPTNDYKTTTVAFEAGQQKMDGLTALRFARSRHGNNGEGSDFARSKRQQKIIVALKDKVTSFNTLINPVKITSLFNLVTEYTRTDLEPWEAVKVARMVKDINSSEIKNIFLDDAPGGFLVGGISSSDGAYILQPRTGSYSELQQLMADLFKQTEVSKEDSLIILQNGTTIPGLALEQVNQVEKFGVDIARYGNALNQDYQTTVIYDYTKGSKPNTRAILENHFQTTARENPPLELLAYSVSERWEVLDDEGNIKEIDFLIILGQDIERLSETISIVETIDPNATTTTSTPELEEED